MIRTCFPELKRAFIVLLTLSHSGAAQEFVISTVAGLYSPGSKPEAGINVSIGNVSGIATDSYGNVYFSSSVANPMGQAQDFVLKLDANGILTRAAGNPIAGYSGRRGTGDQRST